MNPQGLLRRTGTAVLELLAFVLLAGVRVGGAEPPPPTNAAAGAAPATDLYGDPLPPGAIARLGTIRYRAEKNGIVGLAAFAADSKTVITFGGSTEGGYWFCWWDAASGRLLRRVQLEKSTMSWGAAITPGGETAVTRELSYRDPPNNGAEVRLKWWDVNTGREQASIVQDFSPNTYLTVARDGAAVVCHDLRTIGVWDRTNKKQTASYTIRSQSFIDDKLTLAPNGRSLLFVRGDEGLCAWDFASGQERTVLAWTKDFQPYLAAFSPDARTLAVGGRMPNVKLLGAVSGRLLRTLDWPHTWPDEMTFSADGTQLAVANSGGKDLTKADSGVSESLIAVWDVASGKLRHTFERSPSDVPVNSLAFSPDGRLLAAATRVLHVWDLATGKCLSGEFAGHEGLVGPVAFLGQSDTVATAGYDGTVRLWEARTGRQKMLIPHQHPIWGMAVSPDGKLLASSESQSRYVRIRDAGTGRQLHQLAGRTKVVGVQSLNFSADGKRLAAADNSGKVRVWSVESGTLLNENDLQLPQGKATRGDFQRLMDRAVFPPDDQILVADLEGAFHVLSVETGKELRTFGSGVLPTGEMAISADGKRLLAYQYGGPTHAQDLSLWDLPAGKEIWREPLPARERQDPALVFSADGTRYAVSVEGGPREIRVCDLATRKVLQTIKNDDHLCCLRFSPDGRLLVGGLENGTAVTWEVRVR
jgi:WD40 repeat protein